MAACGYYHTLLVTEDGGLWSCGAGSHGQLGHKDCAHQRTPAPLQAKVFGGSRVLEAVAGPRHTIAVVAEGSLWTWGGGIEGQLGSGDMPERRAIPKNLPRAAFGGTPVVLASAGDDHSLALTADGQVWTWGSGREAQQGGDDRIHHLTPACLSAECFGGAKVVSVAAGDDHCVALTAQGDVMTWGRGAYGRLGHNDQDDRRTPTPITRDLFENAPAVFISAGKFHSAAISSDGNLWLWGWNEWGQLGNGDRAHRLVPARLKYVERFECSRVLMVSCGAFHTLALTERGAAWSWGRNTQAQLGLDDRQDRLLPTQILSVLFDDARLCMVTAGLMHSAAVGEDGTLWTWGAAGCDALDPPTPTGLGHGDLQDKLVPTKVSFTGHQHMRIGSCRSLLLQHALVFSMASRQRLGHSDKLELILDQIVEQIVEMEDGIVMKRKLLAVKQSKLEERMQLEKRQIQSLMFDQRKERTVFEEQQEEMDELGRSILKDKSNVLQSTLAAAKLSAEISRQEAKLEELAEKIKAQQQSLAANKSEHAQVLVQIELEESRVAEQNDASDAIRLLLAVAWTLSLRSSHLAALTPTQRDAHQGATGGELSELGALMMSFTAAERARLLTVVREPQREVLLHAERLEEVRLREEDCVRRRDRQLVLARAASCERKSIAREELSEREDSTLAKTREEQMRRELEEDARAGWSGIYRGGSVPEEEEEGVG